MLNKELIYEEPSLEHMGKILQLWEEYPGSARYQGNFRILEEVFKKYGNNSKKEEVIIKASMLDYMYSTNLKDHFNSVVDNIITSNFDTQIGHSEPEVRHKLIKHIAGGKDDNSGRISFASKYCFQYDKTFPVYDKNVRLMLFYINRLNPFSDEISEIDDMDGDYLLFCRVCNSFVEKFGFKNKTVPMELLDQYLWRWSKLIIYQIREIEKKDRKSKKTENREKSKYKGAAYYLDRWFREYAEKI